jgi:uncharacterized protein DUF5675
MNLSLTRNEPIGQAVFGKLSVDGLPECSTLERLAVQIPTGTYPIEMTESLDLTCDCGPNHSLSHLLPLLDNVPGRFAIRIHAGNFPADSEGCILVGMSIMPDMSQLMFSRAALDALIQKIQLALDAGQDVSISIT